MATPEQQKVLDEKRDMLWKACNHIETPYIPNYAIATNALLSHTGVTFDEAEGNPEITAKVFRDFFDVVHVDTGMAGFSATPKTYAALGNITETFLAEDGVTLQHLQRPTMKPDEYPQFLEDLKGFTLNVLLPRKYPQLFQNKEEDLKNLKIIVEEAASRMSGLYVDIQTQMYAEYGFFPLPIKLPRFIHPTDYIFDRYRGFVGTLTDLRRRPDDVKAAINKVYQERSYRFEDITLTGIFASYMPHIPCYLSPKQYYEFFFPYFKEMISNIAAKDNKTYMLLEGRWMPFIESYLDLPKDSCLLVVDDDDIFEVSKAIGHHQVLTGGASLQNCRLQTKEQVIDFAKKVIDECAPGGGFMFSTNKAMVCKGDFNQNVIDAYNFAHEYGRK
ncbi:MAG: hypothetical protein FWG10_04715 [Eubacteriaceae bacterium]|nr:hypothetical protein [Eubacteriaceae bacterium]